eukprot:TRINITY_DN2707_c0_g1_i1.p1 TRINITY_DN2707_c0_g1~~TRINITY_DN2707_c0_g1_i1.p1  ORF type:complete len:395 (-),score=104.50 TRINITY_DN2707_c0_g1_i1:89-1273(-)
MDQTMQRNPIDFKEIGTALVSGNVLLDVSSLLFTALRQYFVSELQIEFDNEWKKAIEGLTLQESLESLAEIAKVDLTADFSAHFGRIMTIVEEYIHTTKPQIGAIATLNILEESGLSIDFVLNIETLLLDKLVSSNKGFFKKFRNIFPLNGKEEYELEKTPSLVIKVRREIIPLHPKSVVIELMNQKIAKISENVTRCADESGTHIYRALEDIQWKQFGFPVKEDFLPPKEYILNLKAKPLSLEYPYWSKVHRLAKTIVLESKIIHGFGRGGKKLGIPTANLEITPRIEEELREVITGVYYGHAEFVSSERRDDLTYDTKIPMVMSIGYNPYFNNKFKSVEAHIIQPFTADFYDEILRVEIEGFIRCEADFKHFDHLIKFIHNDVQLSKDLLID